MQDKEKSHSSKDQITTKRDKQSKNVETAPTMEKTIANKNDRREKTHDLSGRTTTAGGANDNLTNVAITNEDEKEYIYTENATRNESPDGSTNITVINVVSAVKHSSSNDTILESIVNDSIEQFRNDMKCLDIDFKQLIQLIPVKETKNIKIRKMDDGINDELFNIFEKCIFDCATLGSFNIFSYLINAMKRVDKKGLLSIKLLTRSFNRDSLLVSKILEKNSNNQRVTLGKKRMLLSLFNAITMVVERDDILSILSHKVSDNVTLIDVLTQGKDGKGETYLEMIKGGIIGMHIYVQQFFRFSVFLFLLFTV